MVSWRDRTALGLLPLALAACQSAGKRGPEADLEQALRPLAAGESGWVVAAGKVLTLDEQDTIYAPGLVVVRGGRIAAVGPLETLERLPAIPDGFERRIEPEGWIVPGMIDLHSHIQTGGWGDINDMELPINAEFRTSPTIVPGNQSVRRATAAGVTTLFGIPGSGTSMSGFGVLYKTERDCAYEDAVFADPGGLKVAQDSNPQRGAGDFGAGRAALAWILCDANDRARAALEQGRFELELENLKKVHAKELPVLIHSAGSEGVVNTARMWRRTYDTRSVLSHGCFDAWKCAPFVASLGMPVNNGPRMIDYLSTRDGRVVGISDEYVRAGAPLVSLNTDAGVIPAEELFLQGTMASRYGADEYQMLRGLTIHPAKAFGIDARLGSLEAEKDADFSVFHGNPLDPRARVELVLIDGQVQYERGREGQRF